jgi:hypothetical protein
LRQGKKLLQSRRKRRCRRRLAMSRPRKMAIGGRGVWLVGTVVEAEGFLCKPRMTMTTTVVTSRTITMEAALTAVAVRAAAAMATTTTTTTTKTMKMLA